MVATQFYAHRTFLNARGLNITEGDRPLRFWQRVPYEQLRALFLEWSAKVKAAVGPKYVWHVGSSSIPNMCGLLSVDLLCISPVWPVVSTFVVSGPHVDGTKLGRLNQRKDGFAGILLRWNLSTQRRY
jgi:hypothetical protein